MRAIKFHAFAAATAWHGQNVFFERRKVATTAKDYGFGGRAASRKA